MDIASEKTVASEESVSDPTPTSSPPPANGSQAPLDSTSESSQPQQAAAMLPPTAIASPSTTAAEETAQTSPDDGMADKSGTDNNNNNSADVTEDSASSTPVVAIATAAPLGRGGEAASSGQVSNTTLSEQAGDAAPAEQAGDAAPSKQDGDAVPSEQAGAGASEISISDISAMAKAAAKAAMAAAAASKSEAAASNAATSAATTAEDGAAAAAAAPVEQPKRKRTRRGGWDTPTVPVAGAAAVPAVSKGWGDVPKPVPISPLQELQRKLAEEQVAAAMGKAPPVASVAAGAAALGLSTGALSVQAARAATAPSAPGNPRRIYVGSLHYELKESDITAIFLAFGPLKFVDMSHDPATGRHKGFCFVEYAEDKGADAALAAMNGFELAGRPIKVGRPHNSSVGISGGIDGMGLPSVMQLPGMSAFLAQRSAAAAGPGSGSSAAAAHLQAAMTMGTAPAQTKIYVGNVEPHITTEMIKTVFQPFGMVVGAEMVADPNNPGNHKGFGFIQYAQESVARTAIETMANFELAGRSLRVAWAQDQSKPALSVLPPGLSAAATAAQAAALAAKIASSAAGGQAAAQAAARLSAAGHLQAAFGNGNGMGMGMGGGGQGGVAAVNQAKAAASVQSQAAQRAALMQRMSNGRMQGAVGAAAVGGVSRCMCLMNMLWPEDADDEDVKGEILEEARTCGTVEQFVVHQQRASGGTVVAVRVFVLYTNVNEAAAGMRKMHGRFFAGRQVQAAAYDVGMFSRGLLDA